MASLFRIKKSDRWAFAFVGRDGKRRYFRLGKMDEDVARSIGFYLEDLVAAHNAGISPPKRVAAWLSQVGAVLYSRIEHAGLIGQRTFDPDGNLGRQATQALHDCAPNPSQSLAYSVDQVASMVGVHKKLITKLIDRGELRAVRAGYRIIIPASAIEEWLNQPMNRYRERAAAFVENRRKKTRLKFSLSMAKFKEKYT